MTTTFSVPPPPEEYLPYASLVDNLVLGMGAGWITCYIGLSYRAMKEKTYAMAFFAQCSNISWEFVYGGLIYPPHNSSELASFLGGLFFNFLVQYTTVRYGREEWAHSPFIYRHFGKLYAATITTMIIGNLAFAKQIGTYQASFYIATISQLLVSVGCLCQLLVRGATRGFSLKLWACRHLGSACAAGCFYFRSQYWPEVFGFLGSPMMAWMWGTAWVADIAYAVCFWRFQQQEKALKAK